MEKIAIQGHRTRYKDVIKILESLGGKNLFNNNGDNTLLFYYVKNNTVINSNYSKNIPKDYKLYTLEEYEQIQNNMENKRTIQIDLTTAREWYKQGGDLKEIALQAFTEQELQNLPTSWEEYCQMNPSVYKEYYLQNIKVETCTNPSATRLSNPDTFKTEQRAQQFLTLNKLLQIRDYYNQGWEPNWCNGSEYKYCIVSYKNNLKYTTAWEINHLFAFKTEELRDEFLQNFEKDLKTIKEFL